MLGNTNRLQTCHHGSTMDHAAAMASHNPALHAAQREGWRSNRGGVTCRRVRPARCGVPFAVSLLHEAMRSSVSVVSRPMLASACKSSRVEKWLKNEVHGPQFLNSLRILSTARRRPRIAPRGCRLLWSAEASCAGEALSDQARPWPCRLTDNEHVGALPAALALPAARWHDQSLAWQQPGGVHTSFVMQGRTPMARSGWPTSSRCSRTPARGSAARFLLRTLRHPVEK